MLIRFLAGAMGQGTDRTLGAQPVRRAVRWLDVLPALVFGTWSQLCFGQEPDCGGGRWATALADGYVVGTLQRYTEERPTSDERSELQTFPAAEMLISTTAGGVFLRTYGGLDVKPEWRSQAHVFLFARHGGSVKTFLRGPLSAAYDARAMAGKACLDRSTVVALLRSKYPRRGCALFRPIIRRLRSHRYQEAIDHLYAMQLDHENWPVSPTTSPVPPAFSWFRFACHGIRDLKASTTHPLIRSVPWSRCCSIRSSKGWLRSSIHSRLANTRCTAWYGGM